ncbi:hypothetical protein B0T13DRAFT_448218 [Neurospora crassa]|nr:hypothetical protein B0T13DRAFT_448218 [Neurospora crassa]
MAPMNVVFDQLIGSFNGDTGTQATFNPLLNRYPPLPGPTTSTSSVSGGLASASRPPSGCTTCARALRRCARLDAVRGRRENHHISTANTADQCLGEDGHVFWSTRL